jgi:hypothetical protein
MRIEDAESGQRDLLRLHDDRPQPGADLDKGRVSGGCCRPRIGPPPQQLVADEIERGLDRRKAVVGIRTRLGRNLRAERNSACAAGLDLAGVDRGEHLALRDQLRLRLPNQLVVVEAKEEQSDQGQHGHGCQHREHDQPERRPPFLFQAGFSQLCAGHP